MNPRIRALEERLDEAHFEAVRAYFRHDIPAGDTACRKGEAIAAEIFRAQVDARLQAELAAVGQRRLLPTKMDEQRLADVKESMRAASEEWHA